MIFDRSSGHFVRRVLRMDMTTGESWQSMKSQNIFLRGSALFAVSMCFLGLGIQARADEGAVIKGTLVVHIIGCEIPPGSSAAVETPGRDIGATTAGQDLTFSAPPGYGRFAFTISTCSADFQAMVHANAVRTLVVYAITIDPDTDPCINGNGVCATYNPPFGHLMGRLAQPDGETVELSCADGDSLRADIQNGIYYFDRVPNGTDQLTVHGANWKAFIADGSVTRTEAFDDTRFQVIDISASDIQRTIKPL